ncbi:MAG: CRISPR-associated helicase Cas3' [Candidatus Margulisiibacteriota bacterium]|jgi:CRISPR-associated endonuclease/helicase Cas3
MEYFAHSHPQKSWQPLEEHLLGVAEFSKKFAEQCSSGEWGYLAGLWHDLGKYSPDFQNYLKANSGYDEDDQKQPKRDHTSAGAIFAKEVLPKLYPPLAYCIAGHHAGLLNYYSELGISGDLQSRLKKQEFYDKIKEVIPENIKKNISLPIKPLPPEHMHLWIRMLFSCLIDADRLDTERFMKPESFEKRGKYNSISKLKELFEKYMEKVTQKSSKTKINQIRNDVLMQCIRSGKESPGFFSITVPTGGGKTLSSMAWALEHAIKYNKSRIIFAIPYTSIITQTAQVYCDIFGEVNVIEHHSNLDEETNSLEKKLATENWDAPIIVTTNVQLFESLFANRTSRCRKLHNLVNSIIILDEAQMLPPEFLKPIISTLKGLVENFGVSVLFSTATQPALTGAIGSGKAEFKGINPSNIKEIVPNYQQLSNALKRVQLQIPDDVNQPTEWAEIACELQEHSQMLCIVNTRRDCRELYNLMPEGTIHLSRLMCTAHIMDTIADIKKRLEMKEPIRVISTQLIEAGVDIDFPVVYRALAGLDSIAQSAGRCNREGKLNQVGSIGLTKVFCSVKEPPPGLMRKGADTLKELLHTQAGSDFLDPDVFQKYFTLFYSKISDFDKPKIKNLLWQDAMEMRFQFATAGRDFRLIDDKGSQSIIVEYIPQPKNINFLQIEKVKDTESTKLIDLLRRKGPEPWLMRKLQRYSVSVNLHNFEEIKKAGLIEQIHGCWVQVYEALYDSKKAGLMCNGEWLEEIHIV